jgi:membrane protein YdbS with pleckstrin-like domain
MSNDSDKTYREMLWEGRPWILPSVLGRTILLLIIAALIIWLELYSGVAYSTIATIPAILWTVLAFFIIWILSLVDLIIMRASQKYLLRGDSLEIKTGIASLKQFVIVPSGFSDLETRQSILERALGYGSIVIHSQSETDPDRTMIKLRNPFKVSEQIRYVMARPIVRMEKPESPSEPEARVK